MSHFRVSFGIIKSSNGGSAKRRTAYTRCANENDFDFTHKSDELQHSEVMLPAGAPTDFANPKLLWEQAESNELAIRKDAQLARTFEISIPKEVPEKLHADFIRNQLEFMTERGFAVEFSIHKEESLFDAGEYNSHAHAQATLRHLTPTGFASKKDREFNQIMTAKKNGVKAGAIREQFASCQNAFFQKHGIDANVTAKADPDALTLPTASKQVIRALERYRNDEKQALADGTPAPVMPVYVQDFLDERAHVKSIIDEYQSAKTDLKTVSERPKTQQNMENNNVEISETEPRTDRKTEIRTEKTTDKNKTETPKQPADRSTNSKVDRNVFDEESREDNRQHKLEIRRSTRKLASQSKRRSRHTRDNAALNRDTKPKVSRERFSKMAKSVSRIAATIRQHANSTRIARASKSFTKAIQFLTSQPKPKTLTATMAEHKPKLTPAGVKAAHTRLKDNSFQKAIKEVVHAATTTGSTADNVQDILNFQTLDNKGNAASVKAYLDAWAANWQKISNIDTTVPVYKAPKKNHRRSHSGNVLDRLKSNEGYKQSKYEKRNSYNNDNDNDNDVIDEPTYKPPTPF